MRPATQNAGASLERQAIKAWAKRSKVTRDSLLAYLAGRTERDNQKPGGLGRKKK